MSDVLGAGSAGPTKEHLQWMLGELQKVEQHRTDELQNQQARIATVFGANFLALSFLVNVSFNTKSSHRVSWCLAVGLVLIAVGLGCGLIALWPSGPSKPTYLNLMWIYTSQSDREEATLQTLCLSIAADLGNGKPERRLYIRHWLLRGQLCLVGLGLAAILSAVVTRLHVLWRW
jgi:protein-S-isoprenylcysteine O-methyltransferase Ste14